MRYRRVLTLPGVPALVAVSILARLPLGMLPLLVLLGVTAARPLSTAGLALAAFSACSAVASPVRGRLVDRVGPVGVLLGCALAQSGALAALALTLATGTADAAVLGAAAAAGVFLPPAGPVTRAVLPTLVPDARSATAAFALDALLLQLLFYSVGPPLAALLVAGVGAPAALAATAAITLVGVPGLAALTSVRRHRESARPRGHWAGPLRRPAVGAVLATTLCSAAATASLEVVVVAYTLDRGVAGWSGLLLAMLGAGSVAGGLRQGASSRVLAAQYPRWLLGLGAGAVLVGAVVGVTGAPWVVGTSLAVTGLVLAPISACQFGLIGELAPHGTTTEGFTWLFSASLAGNAAGSALGGGAAVTVGTGVAMGLPAGLAVLAAGGALRLSRAVGSRAVGSRAVGSRAGGSRAGGS